jgi:hypothetical protein
LGAGWRATAAGLVLAAATAGVQACPVCTPTAGPAPGQRLIDAERVLVAERSGAEWKTVAVAKGPSGDIPRDALRPTSASPPSVAAVADVPEGRSVVVVQDGLSKQWSIVGPMAPAHGDWLRRVATAKPASEMSEADWRDRVAFLAPYLEHRDPFVAETTYGEIARAPYSAIRTLRPMLDAGRIEAWLDDPKLSGRATLYTLLLGIAGGAGAQKRVDREIAALRPGDDVYAVAALLMADLEVRGAARVAWIEKSYLSDKSRSANEIQAVILALSEQGGADASIPRERVVEAFRVFARSQHPLAGYPAPTLLGWQAWDAVPDYIALLKSKAPQHPASIIVILNYLDRSPRPDAKAAAAAYRASSRSSSKRGS